MGLVVNHPLRFDEAYRIVETEVARVEEAWQYYCSSGFDTRWGIPPGVDYSVLEWFNANYRLRRERGAAC